ncbi:peroxide stress protein YaaA [Rhodophyticola sp. CCM32]|uniref:peroxide stress protein YaaA n=1 Tax=Rhodophyticola sp. CCM32 TaxID=2916397 RepID=UPI00107F5961|nr:peroxide stress protein YaaA [Rhodophyticola sp. CCM32]QBY02155.1 peroxide stress protein YaaA [Rhodophyticola sp. CCM32]
MLTVISPAKRLDWTPRQGKMTSPIFQEDADALAAVARKLTISKLRQLMDISDDLARLTHDRFRRFAVDKDDTRPAALAFAGDTYAGLEAGSLDAGDLRFAQDRLRILSGLYGLLRPLDAIQAYRLEMGSRLKTRKGPSLYAYWGMRLAETLNAEADRLDTDTVINCASVEYFSAVDLQTLSLRVITPVFLEDRPEGPKIVSFFAKKARGAMARFIIENRLTRPDHLSDFNLGGYRYAPALSASDKPVFLRAEAMVA